MSKEISVVEIEYEKLVDFLNYKVENELTYCSFHHYESSINEKRIVWTTTKKYNNSFSTKMDIDNMTKHLSDIMDQKTICGTISKITCSDNCHIVEFSFYPDYKIK
jgi:hypothetical protein